LGAGLYLAAAATLAGPGTVEGDVTNAGTVLPGTATGVLAIRGTYTQTAGGRLALPDGNTFSLEGTGTVQGQLSSAGTLAVGAGSTFTVNGSYSNGGTLAVGAGSTFTVTGDYTQTAAGTLLVTVGPADQYDRFQALTVGGTAALGGTLRLALTGAPAFGDWFQPIAAGRCTGRFAALAGDTGPFSFFYVRDDPELPAGLLLLADDGANGVVG
jgi:hypothetical protein